MIAFETLSLAYFVALGVAAALARVPRAQRIRALAGAVVMAGTIAAASHLPITARLWLGHLYLVAGYWLPVLLVARPPYPAGAARFELWLRRIDAQLGWPAGPPGASRLALELSYLLCYPLVPFAFVIILAGGADAASGFWIAVLASGFACYGTLPWFVARPPRHAALQHEAASIRPAPARGINEWVLRRVSHGMNTFPSGHVAVSVAAALEVGAVAPAAGVVMLVIAAGIAAGAAAGRYHYLVDVLLGVVIGIGASLGT